jgi:glutaredoxin
VPIPVIIYSRPGCHLCDEMKAVVERVSRSVPLAIQEVDISGDPALEGDYGIEIPVLFVDGKKTAKYKITEEELRKVLKGRQDL